MTDLAIFALTSTENFGRAVAARLGRSLDPHEERDFEDGEHKSRPLVNVRGKDVFVIQSLHSDLPGQGRAVNDKLCRFLFFLGALKDASAARVTAVMPYLCYARKDRKSKPRDPVTTRYVARLFEAVGVDHAVTLDVHNLAAFQNAWRIGADHLEAKGLFVDYFAPLVRGKPLVVVSPDVGGVKRADEFRQAIRARLGVEAGGAFMEKYRSAGVVSGEALVGDVAGKTAVIIDDLISTGTTIARAAQACRLRGASPVYAAATHGLFTAKAASTLSIRELDRLVITNSVATNSGLPPDKLVVLDAAPLFAEAIRRIHEGGSIVELLGD